MKELPKSANAFLARYPLDAEGRATFLRALEEAHDAASQYNGYKQGFQDGYVDGRDTAIREMKALA